MDGKQQRAECYGDNVKNEEPPIRARRADYHEIAAAQDAEPQTENAERL